MWNAARSVTAVFSRSHLSQRCSTMKLARIAGLVSLSGTDGYSNSVAGAAGSAARAEPAAMTTASAAAVKIFLIFMFLSVISILTYAKLQLFGYNLKKKSDKNHFHRRGGARGGGYRR